MKQRPLKDLSVPSGDASPRLRKLLQPIANTGEKEAVVQYLIRTLGMTKEKASEVANG